MDAKHFNRFEDLVQRLVEGTFARLFASRLRPLEVANALAHALEDHAVMRAQEAPLAPNRYRVTLNPADHSALLAQRPDLAKDLARHLVDLAREAGFVLPDLPQVRVTPEPDVPLRGVRVSARWVPPDEATAPDSQSTRQMPSPANRSAEADQPLPNRPFLILEGQRHIPIQNATVSLGRSLDNDIIVDDARVSRHHAQLRRRYDRYVVFDLGSTGGTSVNGYPVQECVLEAGDVISLAGVDIIYGEDTPTPASLPRDTGSTPVFPDAPSGQGADQPVKEEQNDASGESPSPSGGEAET